MLFHANGTDALQNAMMALGLSNPGSDKTTFTFVATAEVIAIFRLNSVLVGLRWRYFLISTDGKRSKQKKKAIIPVHLFGQCANMDEIMEWKSIKSDRRWAQSIGADFYFKNGKKNWNYWDLDVRLFSI